MIEADFNRWGQWVGTCEDCGTDHDGSAPDTAGAIRACIVAKAKALGAVHVLAQVDQLDALRAERLAAAWDLEPEGWP